MTPRRTSGGSRGARRRSRTASGCEGGLPPSPKKFSSRNVRSQRKTSSASKWKMPVRSETASENSSTLRVSEAWRRLLPRQGDDLELAAFERRELVERDDLAPLERREGEVPPGVLPGRELGDVIHRGRDLVRLEEPWEPLDGGHGAHHRGVAGRERLPEQGRPQGELAHRRTRSEPVELVRAPVEHLEAFHRAERDPHGVDGEPSFTRCLALPGRELLHGPLATRVRGGRVPERSAGLQTRLAIGSKAESVPDTSTGTDHVKGRSGTARGRPPAPS
jgi:hypothetical protein